MSFLGESSKTPKWGEIEKETEKDETDVEIINSTTQGEDFSGSEEEEDPWEEVDTASSDSGDDSDDDDLIELSKKIRGMPEISFGENTTFEGESCLCKKISDKHTALRIIEVMAGTTPTFDTINCFIDNIIRAYNIIFTEDSNPLTSKKVAFCDIFYRLRHEVMFKCLCLTLNIPVGHSDMPFKMFGIES